MPRISSLECSRCHHRVAVDTAQTVCPACGGFLFVRYDMEEVKRSAKRPGAGDPEAGMLRYPAVLPEFLPVSLGEGDTPLLRSRQFSGLFVKDEGWNPTGSFEDRGMGLAVAAVKHYGNKHLSIASQGQSAASLAAYASASMMSARVFLPQNVAMTSHLECVAFGAEITFVKGVIEDCKRVREERAATTFDLSDFKEPFRLEGVKTMGYELVEQMGWKYPEAVLCPTGIATLAIWKAFEEMEQLGWVAGRRPRVYAMGSSSNSFEVKLIEESGGRAIERSDSLDLLLDWAKQEGSLLSPEGAAGVGAYQALLASGELSAEDRVVVINGSRGLNHGEAIAGKLRRLRPTLPTSLPVGGIITPQ